ncbi:MAG: hypothetical protein AB7O24_04475 [Kofleriaceae bacterium]
MLIVAAFGIVESADPGGMSREMSKAGVSSTALIVQLLIGVVATILMIASGVGYLKQKRFLGRTLGNGYAVASLLSTVVSLAMVKDSFGIMTIIGIIYPVLTLILINGTFKEDLVN